MTHFSPFGRRAMLTLLSFNMVLHTPHHRWLTLIVRRLISSGYLFAKVSSYFSLYFMAGQFRTFVAVLLTNPEE